jgi:hypothetical protein
MAVSAPNFTIDGSYTGCSISSKAKENIVIKKIKGSKTKNHEILEYPIEHK